MKLNCTITVEIEVEVDETGASLLPTEGDSEYDLQCKTHGTKLLQALLASDCARAMLADSVINDLLEGAFEQQKRDDPIHEVQAMAESLPGDAGEFYRESCFATCKDPETNEEYQESIFYDAAKEVIDSFFGEPKISSIQCDIAKAGDRSRDSGSRLTKQN